MIYALDVSGSMYQTHVINEMLEFARSQPDVVKIMLFSHKVLKVEDPLYDFESYLFEPWGTDVDVVFQWMMANMPDHSVTIVSDGFFRAANNHNVTAHCLIYSMIADLNDVRLRIAKSSGIFKTVEWFPLMLKTSQILVDNAA